MVPRQHWYIISCSLIQKNYFLKIQDGGSVRGHFVENAYIFTKFSSCLEKANRRDILAKPEAELREAAGRGLRGRRPSTA